MTPPVPPKANPGHSILAGGFALVVLGLAALAAPFAAPALALWALGAILLTGAVLVMFIPTDRGAFPRGLRLGWVIAATLTGAGVLAHHTGDLRALTPIVAGGGGVMAALWLAEVWRQHRAGRVGWAAPLLGCLIVVATGVFIVTAPPHAGLMALSVFLAANLGGFGLSLAIRALVDRLGAWFL